MGTSTSTYEFLVRQNVSAYTSQLFKSFNVYLIIYYKAKDIYFWFKFDLHWAIFI